MIALFLLLSAASAPVGSAPAAKQSCVRAPGSEISVCGTPPQSQPQQQQPQTTYRMPKLAPRSYGPALPNAQAKLGNGVRAKLRGQSSNSARGRRNQSTATLSVPF